MKKKQTSVDFLLDKLNPFIHYPFAHSENSFEEIVKQAREIDKNIISLAYIDGALDMADLKAESGSDYYKKNYGSI